mmetsp:Transcript_65005/g.76340  ORF Transcript_65005/g.76340 Transcript_65005/m.76340 type:complete len:295 (+) Transcript_65005:26-910(+)
MFETTDINNSSTNQDNQRKLQTHSMSNTSNRTISNNAAFFSPSKVYRETNDANSESARRTRTPLQSMNPNTFDASTSSNNSSVSKAGSNGNLESIAMMKGSSAKKKRTPAKPRSLVRQSEDSTSRISIVKIFDESSNVPQQEGSPTTDCVDTERNLSESNNNLCDKIGEEIEENSLLIATLPDNFVDGPIDEKSIDECNMDHDISVSSHELKECGSSEMSCEADLSSSSESGNLASVLVEIGKSYNGELDGNMLCQTRSLRPIRVANPVVDDDDSFEYEKELNMLDTFYTKSYE